MGRTPLAFSVMSPDFVREVMNIACAVGYESPLVREMINPAGAGSYVSVPDGTLAD